MTRSNEEWVQAFLSAGADQELALAELRELLIHRIQRAFKANSKVDSAFIEDVAQEGLVAILNSVSAFQGRSQFTTWATTITIRIAIAEMRRRRWKDVSLDQLLADNSGIVGETDSQFEPETQRSQLIEAMHRIIAEQLTQKQRTALQAELSGMPQEEIGRRLGSNRNAIYKLVHDARKRLKKGLLAAGFSNEDLAYGKGTRI